jgi:hypothetical protein
MCHAGAALNRLLGAAMELNPWLPAFLSCHPSPQVVALHRERYVFPASIFVTKWAPRTQLEGGCRVNPGFIGHGWAAGTLP